LTAQGETETMNGMSKLKNTKDRSYLYIALTLLFILSGIALTTIIDKNKPQDVRAKASATQGVEAVGVVDSVITASGTVVVSSLVFASSPSTSLGTWTVTAQKPENLTTLIPGDTVKILMDAKSMSVAHHTLSAKEIKKK
jgi:hypothetical protein